jgi:hypothetical protein
MKKKGDDPLEDWSSDEDNWYIKKLRLKKNKIK